ASRTAILRCGLSMSSKVEARIPMRRKRRPLSLIQMGLVRSVIARYDSVRHDSVRKQSLGFVDDLAVHEGEEDVGLIDFGRRDLVDVAVEENDVGEFAWNERSFDIFRELGVGGANGEGADGFIEGDLLLGKPAVGMLAIERLASHSGFETFQGIER